MVDCHPLPFGTQTGRSCNTQLHLWFPYFLVSGFQGGMFMFDSFRWPAFPIPIQKKCHQHFPQERPPGLIWCLRGFDARASGWYSRVKRQVFFLRETCNWVTLRFLESWSPRRWFFVKIHDCTRWAINLKQMLTRKVSFSGCLILCSLLPGLC